MSNDKDIDIIIPCKNEGLGLIETIKSIRKNNPNKIIVSDSSTDNTRDLVKENYPDVTIIEGGLPSIARNNGARISESKYILFIDADMDISSVNLEFMINDVIKNDLHLATCKIGVRNAWYNIPYLIFEFVQKLVSIKTPFAVGGFMLFKKSEFERLGGFKDDDIFAEDYHLSMKVKPKKFKIYKYKALTSDRRLRKKSFLYMSKLMIKCWLNRNDDEFYKKDYSYWE